MLSVLNVVIYFLLQDVCSFLDALRIFAHNLFLDKPSVSLMPKLVSFVTLLNATYDKPCYLSPFHSFSSLSASAFRSFLMYVVVCLLCHYQLFFFSL